MTSSDDDADLKTAIALSLQVSQDEQIIDLTEDSKQDAYSNATLIPHNVDDASKSQSKLGFLGLDRKKMEEERIARRRRLSPSSLPACKRQKIEAGMADISARRSAAKAAPSPTHPSDGRRPDRIMSDRPSSTSEPSFRQADSQPVFLKPAVKKTWAFGHTRTGDDIKLEEVLQKNDLNLAVLSSFQWEIDWLLAKIDTSSMSHLH